MRAECAGSDDGAKRGVHAAREAEHRPGEAVLLEVVPQAEHQGLEHLTLFGEEALDPVFSGLQRAGLLLIAGDAHDLWGVLGALFAGSGLVETLRQDLFRVEIHDEHVLLELSGAGDEIPLRVEDERVPVEDEFVLPAHQVAEDHVATVVGGPYREHPLPEGTLAPVVGRSRDVQEHARTAKGLLARGPARVPDVLADAHPNERAVEPQDGGARAFAEVAVLVEDAVVRQISFVVAVQDLAAGDHGAGVAQIRVEVDKPYSGDDARGNLSGERIERPQVVLYEARPHEEVLGRVARDGELRQRDELRPDLGGSLQGVRGLLGVPPYVADGSVDLRQRNPHDPKYTASMGVVIDPAHCTSW